MEIKIIISIPLKVIISVRRGHYDKFLRSAIKPSYATDKMYVNSVPQKYLMFIHKLCP